MDNEEQKPENGQSVNFSNFYTKKQEETPQAKYVQPNKGGASFFQEHKRLIAIALSIIIYGVIVFLFIFGSKLFTRGRVIIDGLPEGSITRPQSNLGS